jgi:hypothetical protein
LRVSDEAGVRLQERVIGQFEPSGYVNFAKVVLANVRPEQVVQILANKALDDVCRRPDMLAADKLVAHSVVFVLLELFECWQTSSGHAL